MKSSLLHKAVLIALCSAAPFLPAQAAFEFVPGPGRAEPAQQAAPPFDVEAAPLTVQNLTNMTPSPGARAPAPVAAPAASVVSEALLNAQTRTSPRSILPPAPAAPQYTLAPAASVKPPGGPIINMNPLGGASASPASTNSELEQAMMNGGGIITRPSMISPAPVTAAPAPQMSAPARASYGGYGAMASPAPSLAAPAVASGSGQYTEAVGFGRDLPLALAVSQIVPPDYAFSFSNSVNPGDTISWEGGKPWNVVLNDALGSVGASASINDAKKEVTIGGGALASASAVSPPYAASVVPPAYAPAPITPMVPAATSQTSATYVPRPPSAMLNAPLYSPAPDLAPSPAPAALSAPVPAAVTPASAAVLAAAPSTPTPTPVLPAPAAVSAPLPEQTIAPLAAEPAMPVAQAPASPKMQLAGIGGNSVLDPKARQQWQAVRGTTLRAILTDWSMQAGVELFWSSDYDYPVESSLNLNGTFEEAVQTLLSGLRDARPRPIGRLHPNLPDGPSVLVIETKNVIE